MPRPKNFEELLENAKRQPDMIGALASIGVELKHQGHSKYGEHYKISTARGIEGDLSSVVFCANYDGTWVAIDNKERSGKKTLDSIGILTELFGMDFDSAVYALTGTAPMDGRTEYRAPKPVVKLPEARPPEPFVLPEKRPQSSWRGIEYLSEDRLIPALIARELFDLGIIYMPLVLSENTEKPIDLLAWKCKNENGSTVGCEYEATFKYPGQRRYKHIVAGSDQRYGFHFKNLVSEITANTQIYFCESAVDALSLLTLKNYPGVYVSLSGLKDSMFLHMTKTFGGTPVICTDNDDAGNRFRNKYACKTLIPEYGKDWNEELQYRVIHGLDYALKEISTLTAEDIESFLETEAGMKVASLPQPTSVTAGSVPVKAKI